MAPPSAAARAGNSQRADRDQGERRYRRLGHLQPSLAKAPVKVSKLEFEMALAGKAKAKHSTTAGIRVRIPGYLWQTNRCRH
jgi:hypothetical protein